MIEKIHWLGHDTFKIEGEMVIYTDPYQIKQQDVANIILITHEHYDHCSPADVQKLLSKETIVVAPTDCASKLGGKVRTVKVGDSFSIEGKVQIEAVPAYNVNKNFHPKKNGWVGYVITIQGVRIYLAGDTDRIPEMKNLGKIDIALLPVSGTYVMTAREAAEAALQDIKPTIAVPMHYGSIVGSSKDAEEFRRLLEGKVQVVIKG
ncbi:MAG: MBL fold metallo-hydrolase [Spirochaetes bacterium]|nr:MBL fold metallo-hydrolase [Spirochaetota bacterium]